MAYKNRRDFIKTSAAAMTSMLLPGITYAAPLPTNKRFVVMLLRGGMDSLGVVHPYGDKFYNSIRQGLTAPLPDGNNGLIDLDGFFAFDPALSALKKYYDRKELAVIHAVASPYRERSHFDGQNLVENGTRKPDGASSGWLNRTVASYDGVAKNFATTVGTQLPLIMQGRANVASWTPSSRSKINKGQVKYLKKVISMYEYDPQLGDLLREGFRTAEAGNKAFRDALTMGGGTSVASARALGTLMARENNGIRIAFIESGGWDTHANQTGGLRNNLRGLASTLDALAESLGDAWKDTVVTVVTEFGRTARMNGTSGTDHGTASLSFVMGGAVRGGKVFTKWPGLYSKKLYQGRDLKPTTDMRSIFKTILYEHMKINKGQINKIFPNGSEASLIKKLIA